MREDLQIKDIIRDFAVFIFFIVSLIIGFYYFKNKENKRLTEIDKQLNHIELIYNQCALNKCINNFDFIKSSILLEEIKKELNDKKILFDCALFKFVELKCIDLSAKSELLKLENEKYYL